MNDEQDSHFSLLGRLTSSLINRRSGFFFAELVLVIVGVLIALAVDGWISDSQDRETESIYLELLARDIEGIRHQANLQIEFEGQMIDVAEKAYAALTVADPRMNHAAIRSSLALLISRRTLSLRSATYEQMVSSGNLQLIRDHELRNDIVRFFVTMERTERIVENNNRELIDQVFIPFMMRVGITALPRPEAKQVTASLNRANDITYERLAARYALPVDRVLSEPADSDSWNDIRRNVLFRLRISATGQALAERTVELINGIEASLDDI